MIGRGGVSSTWKNGAPARDEADGRCRFRGVSLGGEDNWNLLLDGEDDNHIVLAVLVEFPFRWYFPLGCADAATAIVAAGILTELAPSNPSAFFLFLSTATAGGATFFFAGAAFTSRNNVVIFVNLEVK